MEIKNKSNNIINIEPFLHKINAYKFDFIDNSVTGRLIEFNGKYLTIEARNGTRMVVNIDNLQSIWNIVKEA